MILDELCGKCNNSQENINDIVKDMIYKMEEFSTNEDYEKAKDILDDIKEILVKPDDYQWIIQKIGKVETLKDISDMLYSNSIRLTPKQIGFYNFLNLIILLDKKKDKLQGLKYSDIDKKRKIVAEEMLCLGISMPTKKRYIGKMPNRRFLEIAYKIHPDISRNELVRREYVKLWHAIGDDNKSDIFIIKEEIRRLTNSVTRR